MKNLVPKMCPESNSIRVMENSGLSLVARFFFALAPHRCRSAVTEIHVSKLSFISMGARGSCIQSILYRLLLLNEYASTLAELYSQIGRASALDHTLHMSLFPIPLTIFNV